jgi:hypothetical protein
VRRLVVPLVAIALFAGCGSSEVAVHEVPGDPVDLTVPGRADALAPEATPTASASPESTAAAAATTAPTTEEGAGTQAPEGTDGGGTAAAGEDGTAADEPPPPGSDAEQFETFCAQNPGAC